MLIEEAAYTNLIVFDPTGDLNQRSTESMRPYERTTDVVKLLILDKATPVLCASQAAIILLLRLYLHMQQLDISPMRFVKRKANSIQLYVIQLIRDLRYVCDIHRRPLSIKLKSATHVKYCRKWV
jgi:hypothetical protein